MQVLEGAPPVMNCPRCGSENLITETSDVLPGQEFLACGEPSCTWSEL